MDPNDQTAIVKYLEFYGDVEAPQDPVQAATDSQLKSLTTLLAALASESPGTILDIGAGRGSALKRLTEIDLFPGAGWQYIAVEDDSHHRELFGIAYDGNAHKHFTAVSIEDFYKSWPQGAAQGPLIVIIRNVMHELDIPSTSKLLSSLAAHVPLGSTVVLQDLAVFPRAEKGNACWEVERLEQLLERYGFACTPVQEATRSGNLWFNIVAKRNTIVIESEGEVARAVTAARTDQWDAWAKGGALSNSAPDRNARVAKVDFDLQFAALTLQLLAVKAEGVAPLSRKQEQIAVQEMFARELDSVAFASAYDATDIPSIRHFKDRANSQDQLQAFLASDRPVALIRGPALMGKSALVQHVLSSFAHRRKMVLVDALSSWSAWNLLESILAECGARLPQQVVGRLQHVDFETIRETVAVFAGRAASNVVLVVDHFERLLRPSGEVDPDIAAFLSTWSQAESAKLILTSRRPVPEDVLGGVAIDQEHPPVGRFPKGSHVENLLSMFVARSHFPNDFVDAIDRHPLMAELAGRILKREGAEALHDPILLDDLKGRLREKLLERVCTDLARPALAALMHTRTAVPKKVLSDMVGSASVAEALETGLAYEITSVGQTDRIACIHGFRYDAPEEDDELSVSSRASAHHEQWGRLLASYYKNVDDDPRWLREAFFHTAVSGTPEGLAAFGQQYRSELQDAGEYWFRRAKEFTNARWAFQRVAELSAEVDPFVEMRIASCMIRTGDADSGLALFNRLFVEHPDWQGVRTSCVDGLLYLRRFADALALLEDFADFRSLSDLRDGWILGQFGRTFLGLQRYKDAIEAFSRQLRLNNKPVVVRALARSYHRIGARKEEGLVLKKGYQDHPNSLMILAAYCSWLESNGAPQEAIELLEPEMGDEPDNAWIALAYIQALISTQREPEARAVYDRCGASLEPEFMRATVHATILRAEGAFEQAVRVLDEGSEDTYDSDHRVGQLAEVYAAWADSDPEQASSIASNALEIMPSGSDNLLVNVSIMKLCIAAGDQERFYATLARCSVVNDQSDDVENLKAEAIQRWGG